MAGDGLVGTHGAMDSSYLIIDSEARRKLASPVGCGPPLLWVRVIRTHR